MFAQILAFLLVGCASGPATIDLQGTTTVDIQGLVDPVALPAVKVLDAKGNPIEPAPAVVWTVNPPEIAQVTEAQMIQPLKDGEGKLVGTVEKITAEVPLVVHAPDQIKVQGVQKEVVLKVGDRVPLSIKVFGDTIEFAKPIPATYTTSDVAIGTVEGETFVAVAAGVVTLTATAGELTDAVELTIQVPAPAPK